ncbi:MAG: hypothetical protein ACTSRA_19275 [Promethearchaeota archaeon]
MREWRWELKKAYYQKLKERGVRNLPKLRRGRIGKIGPTRKCYNISVTLIYSLFLKIFTD